MAAVTMEDLEKLKKYFEDSLNSISQRVEQVEASDKQLMSTGFAQVSQKFEGLEEKIAASLSTGEKNIASAMTAAVTSETLDQKLDQLKKYADDKFEAGEKNIKEQMGKAESLAASAGQRASELEGKMAAGNQLVEKLNQVQMDVQAVYGELTNKMEMSKNQNLENVQKLESKHHNLRQELEQWSVQYRNEVQGMIARTAVGDTGRDKGKMKLSYAKECPVGKLAKDCTKEEFQHWRRCVELHIDQIPEWKLWSRVCAKIPAEQTPITAESLDKIVEDVNEESGERLIHSMDWSFADKAQELYTFMMI